MIISFVILVYTVVNVCLDATKKNKSLLGNCLLGADPLFCQLIQELSHHHLPSPIIL
jgi:hypothetical protein